MHKLSHRAVEAAARANIAAQYGPNAEQDFGDHFPELLRGFIIHFEENAPGITAALAVDWLCLVPTSALDQMRHTERKFELIVKHMADLAGALPVEPVSIDGATYIFKDPSPERTLRALQAAVKRAIDLAKDMSDKRIDALLAAASPRSPDRRNR